MAQFGSIKLAARIKFEFTSFEMSTEPEELIRELRDLSLAMQKKTIDELEHTINETISRPISIIKFGPKLNLGLRKRTSGGNNDTS